jgi:GDP-4-dehydro-6-deoxy-D-mannose reductase
MTDVIVTGGTGFIGKHLVPRLSLDNHQVYPVDSKSGDIADPNTWKKFPDANVVIHLAARTFVPDSWSQSAEYMRVNLLGTVQALEYCRAHGARLVFLSSYLYGEPGSLPIPETAPLSAHNPYSLSKILAEKVCQFYSQNFGVGVVLFRPFNIYGAGQTPTFLIPSIISQAKAHDSIRVMDLAPKRDFIYVKDVIEVISSAISSHSNNGIFNIGSGVSHSVAELIATIQEILVTSLPISSSNERRPGEIMDTVADISAANKALGWSPRYSLHDGLVDMLGSS